MFKDYKYLGSDLDTGMVDVSGIMFHGQFMIVDDDFEEIVPAGTTGPKIGIAIIECYIRRGLSVAPNLIRWMLQVREEQNYSLDRQIEWLRKHNPPHWHEVEKDLQMYLLFS